MKIVVIGAERSGTSSPATMLLILVQRWQNLVARLFDPYRPELHYMRGPGPKWREKHGLSERSAHKWAPADRGPLGNHYGPLEARTA